jgi:hypothetical protein
MKTKIIFLTILSILLQFSTQFSTQSLAAIKDGQIISKHVVIVSFAETTVQLRSPMGPTGNMETVNLAPGEYWVWDSDAVLFKDILIVSDFAIMTAQGYEPWFVLEFHQDADN